MAARLVVTRHLLIRLAERNIPLEWVERVALSPAWTEPDFSGPEAAVRAAVELCREGPPAARVREVTEDMESGPVERGFRQAPTV